MLYNSKVSIAYLLPVSEWFLRLHASHRASRFSFSLSCWCIKPPNNFALSSWSQHKDIPRSSAGHLLNSSAYVSLIRVCKSIAMEKGRAGWEGTRTGGMEDCVWSGRRCPCFHELQTAPRSKEYLPSSIFTSCFHASHDYKVLQGDQIRIDAIQVLRISLKQY